MRIKNKQNSAVLLSLCLVLKCTGMLSLQMTMHRSWTTELGSLSIIFPHYRGSCSCSLFSWLSMIWPKAAVLCNVSNRWHRLHAHPCHLICLLCLSRNAHSKTFIVETMLLWVPSSRQVKFEVDRMSGCGENLWKERFLHLLVRLSFKLKPKGFDWSNIDTVASRSILSPSSFSHLSHFCQPI